MRVEFLGGVRTVTGSATLLEKGSLKWLVDCGMFQGNKHLEERNWNLQSYQARELSFILLTHAHIDHSGLIPRLVKEGFRGRVICTEATLDLCEVMLQDSGHIQEMEAEWQNRKGKRAGRAGKDEAIPLYTMEDAKKCLQYFEAVKYGEMLELTDSVKVRFQDAGHILGSAIIELWIEEGEEKKKMIFSGDLGNLDQPLLRDPSVVNEGDVLWLESTYGDRLHKTREETAEELLKIIQEAIAHHAKVIIPAFAVERTQDIIYTVGQFIRQGSIPSVPVYIDSPLAISATEIFKRNTECFDRETQELLSGGKNPLEIPGIIYTRTTDESKTINQHPGPGIIVSASGMCDSGRIQHHLKHHLWREESHIVIIGFQAEGTIGRRIVDGAKTVKLFGEEIAVRAHIHTLGGFSAHADRRGLLNWLSQIQNPRLEVFVNHGEEKISMKLCQLIGEQLHLKAAVPEWREKKVLFGGAEGLTIREEVKEEFPEEPSSVLLNHLDRTYRRLRRKLRRVKKSGEGFKEQWLRELDQVEQKLGELEKELQ